MTPQETVLLTAYVKACCPQQAIGEYTPDAWHDLLGDLELDDCRAAVAAVAKRQPFVAPAEIRAEVKRIRGERLARTPLPPPPAEIAGDPERYKDELQAAIKRIADGKQLSRAIAGPPPGEPGEEWQRVKAVIGEVPGKPDPMKLAQEQLAEIREKRERGERAS